MARFQADISAEHRKRFSFREALVIEWAEHETV